MLYLFDKLCFFVRMGDHVSGPSVVKGTGEPLPKVIASDTSSIGGSTNLPFLFKVLSVTKPLSIQVHPNKVRNVMQSTFLSCCKMSLFYCTDKIDCKIVVSTKQFEKRFQLSSYDQIQ